MAWLPLAGPGLDEALTERLATGKVVGVRALIHDMADTRWVLRDDVAAGLDRVAEAGLAFDVVTSGPAGLALVPLLAARHPSLRIVIDHLGKPPIGADAAALAHWRSLLRAAARVAERRREALRTRERGRRPRFVDRRRTCAPSSRKPSTRSALSGSCTAATGRCACSPAGTPAPSRDSTRRSTSRPRSSSRFIAGTAIAWYRLEIDGLG